MFPMKTILSYFNFTKMESSNRGLISLFHNSSNNIVNSSVSTYAINTQMRAGAIKQSPKRCKQNQFPKGQRVPKLLSQNTQRNNCGMEQTASPCSEGSTHTSLTCTQRVHQRPRSACARHFTPEMPTLCTVIFPQLRIRSLRQDVASTSLPSACLFL